MNVALLIAAALGLAFTVYAIRKPHWPNGAALSVISQAFRRLACNHTARQWRIERTFDGRLLIGCVACRRRLPKRPIQFPRFS